MIIFATSTRSRAGSTGSSWSGRNARPGGTRTGSSNVMSATRKAWTVRRRRFLHPQYAGILCLDGPRRRRPYPADRRSRRAHRVHRRQCVSLCLPAAAELYGQRRWPSITSPSARAGSTSSRARSSPSTTTRPMAAEARAPMQLLAQKYGFENIQIPVADPGSEQSTQWRQVRQINPDWVFLRTWGVSTPVGIKTAVRFGIPVDRIIGDVWAGSEADVIPAGTAAKGYQALAPFPGGRWFRDSSAAQAAPPRCRQEQPQGPELLRQGLLQHRPDQCRDCGGSAAHRRAPSPLEPVTVVNAGLKGYHQTWTAAPKNLPYHVGNNCGN